MAKGLDISAIARRIVPVFALWFLALGNLLANRETPNYVDGDEDSEQEKAEQVMEKIFSYVERNHLTDVQFTSDVYVRHRMNTHRKGHIVRYIHNMLPLESGDRNYLTEAQLRSQYRPPGEIDCKVVAFHTTAKYLPSSRIRTISRFNFQLYEANLFTDRILNPLHKRNRRFYKYTYKNKKLTGSTATACIEVRPRFSNDELIVRADFDIDEESGAVKQFFIFFHYGFQNFAVSGKAGLDGYETLVPAKMHIYTTFHLLGNHVEEISDVFINHHFNIPPKRENTTESPYDLTKQCLLQIDTTKIVTERAFFENNRPIPLRRVEKEIYSRFDEKQTQGKGFGAKDFTDIKEDKNEPDSLLNKVATDDSSTNSTSTSKHHRLIGPRTQEVLLSSHSFQLDDEGRASLRLPAIITPSMVQWSKSKGVSLQARIRFRFKMNAADEFFSFNPCIGYSFKQKQVYWDLPVKIDCFPRINGEFTIEAGGGSHMYSSQQADEVRSQLKGVEKYDSLLNILNNYGFHYYKDTHVKSNFAFSPISGLKLNLGLRFYRRTMVEWNDLAASTGMKHHLSSIGPRIQIQWTPGQYFYMRGKRRIPLYSKYPTFTTGYERGYALGTGQTAYERFEGDIRYRLPLYALRSLYFSFGWGVYTQRSPECFLDYDYFRYNYLPEGLNDEMAGEFQLLSSHWYNESRYYLRLTSTYESSMLLLSKLPVLCRYVQKERIYFNLLSVKSLNLYSECGYGVSTNLLDISTFVSIAPEHSVDIGFKFVLRLFED